MTATGFLRAQGNRLHALSHLVDGKLSPGARRRAWRAVWDGHCLLCGDSPAVTNCVRCGRRPNRRRTTA